MSTTQPSAPTEANRRASRRRPPRGKVKTEFRKGAMGLGPNLAETLLDISEVGARLVIKAAIQPGEHVEIVVMGQGHTRPVSLQADVVWSIAKENGRHLVGVRFRKPLSYADLQHLT